MSFSQFLLVLRTRQRLIWVTLLITVGTALALSLFVSKTYKATATLVLNYKGVDPVSGFTLPAQLMPGYIATQVDILTSKNVALRVVDMLRLTEVPSVRETFMHATDGEGDIREWIAELLLKKLDVVPSRESSVLDIHFKGTDPKFASDVANAFATAYQRSSVLLKLEPLKNAAAYFDTQVEVSRVALEKAQNDYSTYQQSHNLLNSENRTDIELVRYNELSSQLVAAQGELMQASARSTQNSASAIDESPAVVGDPLIQNLKSELIRAKGRLAVLAEQYQPAHPQYKAAQAEVDGLVAELRRQTGVLAHSGTHATSILARRESEIKDALAAQKARILEQQHARDALALLGKEVETAQRTYDAASLRSSQSTLESRFNQSDIVVLNPALPPQRPSSPNVGLNVAVATVLGLVLGLAMVFVSELADHRVRSRADLLEVIDLPFFMLIDSSTGSAWPAPIRLSGAFGPLVRRITSN
jgi:succinoglycan biosynthesis transport protein ExoP